MPTQEPQSIPVLNGQKPQVSFTVRSASNGFIAEVHGNCEWKQFVFLDQESLFAFLKENL